jgi:hypothetical protein
MTRDNSSKRALNVLCAPWQSLTPLHRYTAPASIWFAWRLGLRSGRTTTLPESLIDNARRSHSCIGVRADLRQTGRHHESKSLGIVAQDGLSAQTSSQSTSAKTITVTGCVNRSQQTPTGTTGTSGATSKETKFVLTNASHSTSGTTGTSGATTPPATAIASEYRLDSDDAKLIPHVGHKVEITGTVEQPTGTEQKPAASAANAPTLKVDNVKMVSTTCP